MKFPPKNWPLGVVLLLGLGLRVLFLGDHSAWLDEAETLQKTQQMNGFLGEHFHPPLHFLFLGVWRQFFGPSIAVARLLSVIWSLGAIALTYFIALRISHHRSAALFAALLLALAPWDIWQAKEARMYSQWVFFFLLTYWGLLHAKQRWGTFAYLLGLLGGLGTHYYMFLYVMALLPCWLYLYGREPLELKQKLGKHLFAIHMGVLAVGIVYLFLHPVMERHRLVHGMAWHGLSYSQNRIYANLSAPGKLLLGNHHGLPGREVFLFSLLFTLLGFLFFWSRRDRRQAAPLHTLLWLTLVPLSLIYWIPIKSGRAVYTLPSLPLCLITVALALFCFPGRVGKVLSWITALALAVFSLPETSRAVTQREVVPWNRVCRALERGVGNQDLILVSAPYMIDPLRVCYPGPAEMVPDRTLSRRVNLIQLDRVRSLIRNKAVIWYVQKHVRRTDPNRLVSKLLVSHYKCVRTEHFYDITLSQYSRCN